MHAKEWMASPQLYIEYFDFCAYTARITHTEKMQMWMHGWYWLVSED